MLRLDERYVLSITGLAKNTSLWESLPWVAEAGFGPMEIRTTAGELGLTEHPDIQGLRTLMDSLGLWFYSVHAPFQGLNLGHPEPARLQGWLQEVGKSLEVGVEMGAEVAVIHANGDPKGLTDADCDGVRERSIEFVNKLADRADELGIKLALENMIIARHMTRRFGSSMAELVQAFPDERIGFCLDLGHAVLNGMDLEREIEIAGKRLIATHVASNDGQTDLHRLPNDGVVDWAVVKRALQRAGYSGKYCMEISLRISDWDPVGYLKMVSEFVRRDAQEGNVRIGLSNWPS